MAAMAGMTIVRRAASKSLDDFSETVMIQILSGAAAQSPPKVGRAARVDKPARAALYARRKPERRTPVSGQP
tara:strand:+ start:255 stop:470 length:216 start_codon:yes stop_codon:yes gene_type:complete